MLEGVLCSVLLVQVLLFTAGGGVMLCEEVAVPSIISKKYNFLLGFFPVIILCLQHRHVSIPSY